MVIDKLENLEKYVSLNPLFAQAVEFLKTTDLNAHEIGKVVLKEGELIVNFAQARPKTKEEAKLETHNNFIDIQIPLSGVEQWDILRAQISRKKNITQKKTLLSTKDLQKII